MIKVYCDVCNQEIQEWLIDTRKKKHFCSLLCKGIWKNKISPEEPHFNECRDCRSKHTRECLECLNAMFLYEFNSKK